mgnify:CR=1 FL=1
MNRVSSTVFLKCMRGVSMTALTTFQFYTQWFHKSLKSYFQRENTEFIKNYDYVVTRFKHVIRIIMNLESPVVWNLNSKPWYLTNNIYISLNSELHDLDQFRDFDMMEHRELEIWDLTLGRVEHIFSAGWCMTEKCFDAHKIVVEHK